MHINAQICQSHNNYFINLNNKCFMQTSVINLLFIVTNIFSNNFVLFQFKRSYLTFQNYTKSTIVCLY